MATPRLLAIADRMLLLRNSADIAAWAARAPTAQSAYLAGWAASRTEALATNIRGQIAALAEGDQMHSAFRPEPHRNASYIGSFSRFYIDLAAIEFARAPDRLLRILAAPLPAIAAALRRVGVERAVWIGESLLATGPFDNWSLCDLAALTEAASAAFPAEAIILKSLNDHMHKPEMARLQGLGYRLVPARSIWIFDAAAAGWRTTRNFRGDRNNLARLPAELRFEHGPFEPRDFERMMMLHQQMLSTHPNRLHPCYSAAFYRLCHDSGMFKFAGLRDVNGEITAFIMLGDGSHALSASAMGIDQFAHRGRSIYPSLVAMSLVQSIAAGKPLNLGYGADRFKRLRGARPALEYHAVYVRHLPRVRRVGWLLLLEAIRKAAGPALARLGG